MDVQRHSGFYMVGLAARTHNAAEKNGEGKIGEIWQTLLKDNLAAKIPNKLGIDLIGLYTDYESNHTGHFTYLLGLPVSSILNVPPKFVARYIPGGRYALVVSNRGPVAQVVSETWQRIWTMPPNELGGVRSYRADYEVYDQRSADPENAQVDVFVGLR